MSEDAAVLSALHGLRLPEAGLDVALAAFALGLMLAALIGAAAWALGRRRESRRARALRRLDAARRLLPGERMVALAALLREETEAEGGAASETWLHRARERFDLPKEALAGLGPALYLPGAAPDPAPLEAALARAFGRLKG